MASKHSYGATLKNNKTEGEALAYVVSTDSRYQILTKEERRLVMQLFGLDRSFSRAFDLVYWISSPKPLTAARRGDLVLVELKTSQKYLPHNPVGFFFGATENEFALARKLGSSYRFCFVSLNAASRSVVTRNLSEVEALLKTKRTQYQINL